MEVRAHFAMVIDLGQCLGCQACTLACRRERSRVRGAEHAWLAHLETRPGPGFPRGWDSAGPGGSGASLDDHGEPWTLDAEALLLAPGGDDRPSAPRLSALSGLPLDGRDGPWRGAGLRSAIEAPDGADPLAAFFLPRLCNHCLRPACAEACGAGAIEKRGDGAVVAARSRCSSEGSCASACRYGEAFRNWSDGGVEKCDLCLPRLEQGRAPACVEACAARFFGVVLYDAGGVDAAAAAPEDGLVEAQRRLLLDPEAPGVLEAARAAGVPHRLLEAAARSPIQKLVARWRVALPLLPESRALPMVFYVPPVPGEDSHLPRVELARLFAAGSTATLRGTMTRVAAARAVARTARVGDVEAARLDRLLAEAQLDRDEAEALAKLLAGEHRVVVPAPEGGR